MNWLLLGTEHWITKTLHLKVETLHQELKMLVLNLREQDMYQCTTRERGSKKLTGLRKVGPSVAFGMLGW
jgi:hypothetical protein